MRVGESITASAGTVILALLTLLLASFGLYHDLGVPLAVGVAVMLADRADAAAGAAGDPRPQGFLALEDRARHPARGRLGQGRRPAGAATRRRRWSSASCCSWRSPPARSATTPAASAATRTPRRAPMRPPATQRCPSTSRRPRSNPANLVLAYPSSVWQDPSRISTAESSLRSSGQLHPARRSAAPNGTTLTPAQLSHLHSLLGPPQHLPVLRARRIAHRRRRCTTPTARPRCSYPPTAA